MLKSPIFPFRDFSQQSIIFYIPLSGVRIRTWRSDTQTNNKKRLLRLEPPLPSTTFGTSRNTQERRLSDMQEKSFRQGAAILQRQDRAG